MRKKRIILSTILIIMLFGMSAFAGVVETGNGAPSGEHFNLNIIGVNNPKTATMDGSSGHVIFVPLTGKAKIELEEAPEGEGFAVLDANATDGPAQFQLPDPGLDPYIIGEPGEADTMADYSVFVRSLGKPGGWSTITTCAELMDSSFGGLLPKNIAKEIKNELGSFGGYASIEQVGQPITFRDKGKSSFENVTAELLTIVFKVEMETIDGVMTEYVRVPIFDDSIEGEYWEYDNNNLKLLKVRFYPGVPTDVTDAD